MSDWRPGFQKNYKQKIQKWLDDNPEIPFEKPREFMKFCTDRAIMDYEINKESIEQEKKKIREELKESIEEMD